MKISISAPSSTFLLSLISYIKILSSSKISPYFFHKNLQTAVIIAKWIIYGVRIWLSQMPILPLFQTSNLNYIGKGHFLISRLEESASLFGTLVRRWVLAIILSHLKNTWKLLGIFSVEQNCVSKCTPEGRELVIELTHKHSLEFFGNLYGNPQWWMGAASELKSQISSLINLI